MNFNKVILGGRLCADPVTKTLAGGTTVCEIRLAVNHNWTTQAGEKKESVCFIDATAFNRQAEVIGEHFRKGAAILIDGRLDFQVWDGKDGTKRSKHTIIINGFSFVGPKQPADGDAGDAPREPARRESRPAGNAEPPRDAGGGRWPEKTTPENVDPPFGGEKQFDEADIPF